jgi:hypothetical protein
LLVGFAVGRVSGVQRQGTTAEVSEANKPDDTSADATNELDEASAERVARNDAAFRLANEEIRAMATQWNMDGPLPAICECADPSCTTVVRVTPRQYEAVRSDPRWFINAPGHQINAHGWAYVISENDRFVVVEKIGEAGEIAEDLDPRDTDAGTGSGP